MQQQFHMHMTQQQMQQMPRLVQPGALPNQNQPKFNQIPNNVVQQPNQPHQQQQMRNQQQLQQIQQQQLQQQKQHLLATNNNMNNKPQGKNGQPFRTYIIENITLSKSIGTLLIN